MKKSNKQKVKTITLYVVIALIICLITSLAIMKANKDKANTNIEQIEQVTDSNEPDVESSDNNEIDKNSDEGDPIYSFDEEKYMYSETIYVLSEEKGSSFPEGVKRPYIMDHTPNPTSDSDPDESILNEYIENDPDTIYRIEYTEEDTTMLDKSFKAMYGNAPDNIKNRRYQGFSCETDSDKTDRMICTLYFYK